MAEWNIHRRCQLAVLFPFAVNDRFACTDFGNGCHDIISDVHQQCIDFHLRLLVDCQIQQMNLSCTYKIAGGIINLNFMEFMFV